MPRKVNLFIIGAAKCGTTSLFRYLEQRPDFYTTQPKEPRFFAKDIPATHRPITDEVAYARLYCNATDRHRYIVDASPAYMYSCVAAEEIHQYNPDARIVVMLRPPAEAVHSVHAQYLWQSDEDVADFAQAWKLSDARAQGRHLPPYCRNPLVLQYNTFALFGEQLERYYRCFNKEQIFPILLEEMQQDVSQVYTRLMTWLGLDPNIVPINFSVRNANTVHRSHILMRVLRGKIPGYRLIRNVAHGLGLRSPAAMRKKLIAFITVEQKRKPIPSELEAEIVNYYAADVEKLENLLNRDLSSWRTVRSSCAAAPKR